jgi:hypothetical protein
MARARRRSGARLARALVALALLGACAATVRGALLRRGASDASGARPPARAPPPPRPADGSSRRFANALSDDPLGANPAEGEAWTPELALAPTAPPPPEPPRHAALGAPGGASSAPAAGPALPPPGSLLFVTFATRELAALLDNWIAHATRAGGAALSNVVVVALDAETREHARRAHPHVAVIDASEHLPRGDARRAADASSASSSSSSPPLRESRGGGFRENKRAFNAIGVAKVRFLAGLLFGDAFSAGPGGYDVLVSDVDVVWFRDPSRYLASGQLAAADVAASSDCLFGFEPDRAAVDAFGQIPDPARAEFNTGVLLLRRSRAVAALMRRWAELQAENEDPSLNDQSMFNRALGRKAGIEPGGKFPLDGDAVKRKRELDEEEVEVAVELEARGGEEVDEVEDASRGFIVGSAKKKKTRRTKKKKRRFPAAHVAAPDARAFPEAHARGLRPRLYVCGDEALNGTRVRVALLPTGAFPNGHAFFVSRAYARGGGDESSSSGGKESSSGDPRGSGPPAGVFAAHNTYQYSGAAGKVARFRENGLWAVDGAEYYGVAEREEKEETSGEIIRPAREEADPGGAGASVEEEAGSVITSSGTSSALRKGRFLALRYDIPARLLDPAPSLATPKGAVPSRHLELIQFQVDRVRDGLALADATKRALVMPPLVCTCDRWFNLLPNCTQGDVQLPFLCPLDHVFLVFALDALDVEYRDRAFFANRRRFLTARGGRAAGGGGEESREAYNSSSGDESSSGESSDDAFLTDVARLTFLAAGETDRRFSTNDAEKFGRSRRSRLPRFPEVVETLPGAAPTLDPATAAALDALPDDSPRRVSAPRGADAETILRRFGGAADRAAILVVDGLGPGAFGGFGSARENRRFDAAAEKTTHQWCCHEGGVAEHKPTKFASANEGSARVGEGGDEGAVGGSDEGS